MSRYEAAPALAALKDFQRTTAEYVYARLYEDAAPARRFLIADEVGLGKTLVARGVIAKAIEHLQDVVERVDVIYICSNALIARQNLRRLGAGTPTDYDPPDRITMLPATAHELAKNRINFVAFTPGTSLELTAGSGKASERALLRLVLSIVWGEELFRSRGSMRVFQAGVSTLERFAGRYRDVELKHRDSLDKSLVESFADHLAKREAAASAAGKPTLRQRFDELRSIFGHSRPVTGWADREYRMRNEFVSEMRGLMARACLDALRPDLIILDEFQRFKHLLAQPGSPDHSAAAELANELFEHVDRASGSQARVLLLSATPYRMYTTSDEADENHHEDLVNTAEFLLNGDPASVDRLRRGLRSLRRGLLQVGRDGGEAAAHARRDVEQILRRVMVRTERLSATPDRCGMLADVACRPLKLDEADVGGFVAAAQLARELRAPDMVEYWKSTPYVVNFAEEYAISRRLNEVAEAEPRRLARLLDPDDLLPYERMRSFERVAIPNSRMRWLVDDTVGRGSWKLLWIPPSLPYLASEGPFSEPPLAAFTKRLVFSAWTMVPTAVSTLLTYEAERRMVSAGGRPRYENTTEARAKQSQLLSFASSEGRLTGMPVIALLYSAVVLGSLADPLELARTHGGPISAAEAVSTVEERLGERLAELSRINEGSAQRGVGGGRADERWYWVAPLWLDRLAEREHVDSFFADMSTLRKAYTGPDKKESHGRFEEHLGYARKTVLDSDRPNLGPMPADLPRVLALLGLSGYATCAGRALARVTGRKASDPAARLAACKVAWGIRSLFNGPEATEVVHHLHPGERYWERTLEYATSGNIQSVLDEYAHTLIGSRGHLEAGSDEALEDLADAIARALELRTVRYRTTRIERRAGRVRMQPERLRAHYALRLSDEHSDDGTQVRLSEVRDAFNSPFRPFVIATTSAGQEGLDFHPYCHAVVHWNLPNNPVDLEQREGRVHRYEGHAVRRNVAAHYRDAALHAAADPWTAMFAAARHDRPSGFTDIVPHWIYTGGERSVVERYIPALPLSRDSSRARALRRAVASYRLAFGQPRQEDLLAYLADEVDQETLDAVAEELRVDLSPG